MMKMMMNDPFNTPVEIKRRKLSTPYYTVPSTFESPKSSCASTSPPQRVSSPTSLQTPHGSTCVSRSSTCVSRSSSPTTPTTPTDVEYAEYVADEYEYVPVSVAKSPPMQSYVFTSCRRKLNFEDV